MTDPGSAISVSLEELERRIRAIIGRRDAFPAPEAVSETTGPTGGPSQYFASRLDVAAATLSRGTALLGSQLHDLGGLLEMTGRDLVATDESVAEDVGVLQQIAQSVAVPRSAAHGTSAKAPTSGSTGSTTSDDDTTTYE